MYQTEKSKYLKSIILAKNDHIAESYLPEFELYSKDVVLSMLLKYETIFLKPDTGTGGYNTYRVRRKEGNKLEIMNENGTIKHIPEHSLPDWSQERYYVQEGIESVGYEGKSVEMRAYLQKEKDEWKIRAIVPKIAPDTKRFSSVSYRGGKTLPFSVVFSNGPEEFEEEVKHACYLMADQLNKYFPGIHELGFDLGVDKLYRVRFIEANTKPQLGSIRLTGDNNLYQDLYHKKQILYRTPTQGVKF